MADDNVCRMCMELEPSGDLIRCCACSGSVAKVHRECLDKWRAVSPHPDAMVACELCRTKYRLILKTDGESDFLRNARYVGAVLLDLTLMLVLFAGIYLLTGFLGDLSFTQLIKNVGGNQTVNKYMPFLAKGLWDGRIWFWGFIVFFFILGVVGSCLYCCFKDEGSQDNYGHEHYSNSSCWWIFCGPSYNNGYYYYSPYGYWGPGDLLCFYWIMTPHYGYHQHPIACCNGCDCARVCMTPADCTGGNNDCGKDGLIVIAVIIVIVVLVFVIIGVFVGSLLTFLLVNKVMKRHLTLLERQANTQRFIVANLDNQSEVNEANFQEQNGQLAQFSEVLVALDSKDDVNEPLNKPPKGKQFDTY